MHGNYIDFYPKLGTFQTFRNHVLIKTLIKRPTSKNLFVGRLNSELNLWIKIR